MSKTIDENTDDMLLLEMTPEDRMKLGELLSRGIECSFRVSCEYSDSRATVIADNSVVGWDKAVIRLTGGVGIVTIELTDEQLLDAVKQVMSSSEYLASEIKAVLEESGDTDGQDD